MTNEGLSLVDVAELLLKDAKEPIDLYEIFDKVCKQKGIKENAKNDLMPQFYADLTVSAKFVYTGENKWDLKPNQKIELWEKDGSFYKEYTVVDLPDEYKEPKKPKAKAKPTKAALAKAAKAEAALLEKAEALVAEEAKLSEEAKAIEEAKVVEAVVESVAGPDGFSAKAAIEKAKAEAEAKGEEYTGEEFDEELFDDFDEDKYNEYMDTYEDQYKD